VLPREGERFLLNFEGNARTYSVREILHGAVSERVDGVEKISLLRPRVTIQDVSPD